jgi:putative restriction endonuclease
MLDARDDLLRAAAFSALDVLRARLGDTLPLHGAIAEGFNFNGTRVPFKDRMSGIYRAAEQLGTAALSVWTSANSPYGADEEADKGYWYAYQNGAIDNPDNRKLREAHRLQVPIIYFRSFQRNWYTPIYPVFVEQDDPLGRRVFLSPGVATVMGDSEPAVGVNREYTMQITKRRLHQGRFRGLVMQAYAQKCTICQLKEPRLLEAAHIRADSHPDSTSMVTNGLSLCSIHHRAYDESLIGIDPDYRVHVAKEMLIEKDGPMLDLLNASHGSTIVVPRTLVQRPDRELLAERFERFQR